MFASSNALPDLSLNGPARAWGWLRIVLAIVAGFVVWFAVATVGNWAIRWPVPGYADVERSMEFSLGMLVARLVLGAIASVVAGAACAAVARGATMHRSRAVSAA